MNLPKLCIERPVMVSMIFLAGILFGTITFKLLPVEMMPNRSFGHITIYVGVRGGMPASEIEKRVAKPIEEAVGSVSHLKNILSISKEGNTTVILQFELGTDMDFAALEVREKFNRIRNKLPKEIEKPIIAKYEYTDVPIMIVAVMSNSRSAEELRKIVDEKIKDAIQRIEGVAKVEVTGGREGKIIVEVDKYKLQSFSLPISLVVEAINANNLNLLAGEIKKKKDKYLVRTIGELRTLDDIGNLVITATEKNSVIRIKDVAKVEDSYLDPVGFSRVNTKPSVSLYIQKESLANTVKVVSLIEKEIDKLRKKLDKDIRIVSTYNQAEYIKTSIKGVKISLLLGAILAFSILFLFLRDFAGVMIMGIAIPISVFSTFALMYFTKLSINLMTLSGLALGVGMLVDNSIVVIENVFKKIENIYKTHKLENPDDKQPFVITQEIKKKVAAVGTQEMFLAILASTITTLAVFLPIIFINPETRSIYSGMALTIIYALCTSFLCAFTLIPMLLSRIKIRVKERGHATSSIYNKAIKICLKFRYLTILVAIVIFIVSLHQTKKLEKEFMGISEQNEFTIFIQMETGTRLEVSDKIVSQVERFVSKLPEVKNVTAKIEPWSSKIFVELQPLSQRKLSTAEVINKIRPFTEKLKPAFIYFEEPQEVGTKEIIIEIFGYDYEILKGIAMEIGRKIKGIQKFTDVKIRMREGRPEMLVKINKAKAAMMGLSVKDIALILHTHMRGLVATRFRGLREPLVRIKEKRGTHTPTSTLKNPRFTYRKMGEAEEIETIVRLRKEFRKTFEDLKRINLLTPEGEIIYLSQIADFEFSTGPSEIWRKNKARMIQVSANTGGMALGTAGEKVKEVLKDLSLPKDYFWQLGGTYDKMIRNQKELTSAIFLSIIIIYMILASLFESFSQPLIILITVPLAAVGATLALKLTNKPISIGVLMGIILLGGIIVNNAIILVDRINFLKRKFKGSSSYDTVIKAATDRVRPILMTSSTTIASMFFMAIDRSESANLWSPLAITVIGGMVIGTSLTLFVVPSIYLIFEDIKRILKFRR